jgi:ankyrin repeat protein
MHISIGARVGTKSVDLQQIFCVDDAEPPVDEINRLLQQGFDPSTRDILGRTLLHWACIRLSLCVARSLLGYGAPVNVQDHKGVTPLMFVLKQDSQHAELQEEFVRLLLLSKAEVNPQYDNSVTPLMLASVKGQHKIAELLLQHGAQVDALGEDLLPDLTTADGRVVSISPGMGYTALSLAGMIDDMVIRSAILSLLLRHGANAELASRLLNGMA